MAVSIKMPEEIAKMRVAGRLAAEVLESSLLAGLPQQALLIHGKQGKAEPAQPGASAVDGANCQGTMGLGSGHASRNTRI